jgi:hypothetical protein
MSQIFGNHWIEEFAAGDFGGGDEPGNTRAAPRRNDLDVEPRLRPVLPIGRPLVQPHHVRQRLVVQPVEPIEDVDEQRRQNVATAVAERRKIWHLFVWREGECDRKRRSLGDARTPSAARVAVDWFGAGDESVAAVGFGFPTCRQQ